MHDSPKLAVKGSGLLQPSYEIFGFIRFPPCWTRRKTTWFRLGSRQQTLRCNKRALLYDSHVLFIRDLQLFLLKLNASLAWFHTCRQLRKVKRKLPHHVMEYEPAGASRLLRALMWLLHCG